MAQALIDRKAELRAVAAAVERASRGEAALLVVEGEAGIGKSSLLARAAAQARAAGATILTGTGDELERDRPFGLLAEALGPAIEGVDLQPVHGPSAAEPVAEVRYRLIDAAVAHVEALTVRGPVALVLDDVQWADPSTVIAVRAIARRIRDRPLLLVVAARPLPRGAELAQTIAGLVADGAGHLQLEPLTESGAGELARSLSGAAPGPALERLVRGAGGNPLFVTELIVGLAEEGRLATRGGLVDVVGADLPGSFADRVQHRVGRLGDATTDMLRLASVLGTAFRPAELAALAGTTVAQLLTTMQPALDARLLVAESDRLSFRHDLLREVIHESLPPAVRAALHRDAARVLAQEMAPASRVAAQLVQGAEPGDRDAVDWLHRAAKEASPRAPAAAIDLIDRALELLGADAGRDDLLRDRVAALAWAGRSGEAEALARELLARTPDGEHRLELRRHLAGALFVSNRSDEAGEQLATLAGELTDPADRAQALAEAALCRLTGGNRIRAIATASDALDQGRACGDPDSTALAAAVLGMVESQGLRPEVGLALAQAGVAAADGDPRRRAHRYQPLLFCAFVLYDLDRLDEALRVAARGARLCDELQVAWVLPLYQQMAAFIHLRCGALDDAEAEAQAGLAVADDVGARLGLVWGQSMLSLIALHRGDRDGAALALAHADESLATGGAILGLDLLLVAKAARLEAEGDDRGALSVAYQGWELMGALELLTSRHHLAPVLARLSRRTGDRDVAAEVAAGMEASATAMMTPSTLALASLCRGLADGDADTVVASVARYRQTPLALETGIAAEQAAAVLAGAGRRDEAKGMVAEAVAAYENAGAAGDIARVEQLAVTMGLRSSLRETTRPQTGWNALTATEQRVVRLVAQGLANREVAEALFVSRRTVETHLAHAYAKLGIRSRVKLAIIAAAHPAA